MQYTPADPPEQPVAQSVLTSRRKLLILGAIVSIAFAYFAFSAFVSATSFYVTVDEFFERGPVVGERIQVKGRLVENSFQREDGTSLAAAFLLEENGRQLHVTHDGVLPDLFFNPYSEIVLGGTYTAQGVFVTDQILVKCPSKYQALEVDNPYDSPSA
ncbi:MAG: cytochrome c maturation protein CcmE [Dehalococcoidia bacterium]